MTTHGAALAIGGLTGCATTEPANPHLPTQQSLKTAHEQQITQQIVQNMHEQQVTQQIATPGKSLARMSSLLRSELKNSLKQRRLIRVESIAALWVMAFRAISVSVVKNRLATCSS